MTLSLSHSVCEGLLIFESSKHSRLNKGKRSGGKDRKRKVVWIDGLKSGDSAARLGPRAVEW